MNSKIKKFMQEKTLQSGRGDDEEESSQSYLFMKKGINQLDEIKLSDLKKAQKGVNQFVISSEIVGVAMGLENRRVFS